VYKRIDRVSKKKHETARNTQVAAVCHQQADIGMRSHRLLWLDDNKSVASC
jgi:hypothetical protein